MGRNLIGEGAVPVLESTAEPEPQQQAVEEVQEGDGPESTPFFPYEMHKDEETLERERKVSEDANENATESEQTLIV